MIEVVVFTTPESWMVIGGIKSGFVWVRGLRRGLVSASGKVWRSFVTLRRFERSWVCVAPCAQNRFVQGMITFSAASTLVNFGQWEEICYWQPPFSTVKFYRSTSNKIMDIKNEWYEVYRSVWYKLVWLMPLRLQYLSLPALRRKWSTESFQQTSVHRLALTSAKQAIDISSAYHNSSRPFFRFFLWGWSLGGWFGFPLMFSVGWMFSQISFPKVGDQTLVNTTWMKKVLHVICRLRRLLSWKRSLFDIVSFNNHWWGIIEQCSMIAGDTVIGVVSKIHSAEVSECSDSWCSTYPKRFETLLDVDSRDPNCQYSHWMTMDLSRDIFSANGQYVHIVIVVIGTVKSQIWSTCPLT